MNQIDRKVAIILDCLDSNGEMVANDEARIMNAYSDIAMLAVDMAAAMDDYIKSFDQKRCNPEVAYNRFHDILYSDKYVSQNSAITKMVEK